MPSPPRSSDPPSPRNGNSTRERAGRLFDAGASQAEIARTLRVSRQTASRWHAKWSAGGLDALVADVSAGRRRRVSTEDLLRVGRALRLGPRAHGFDDDRWTCRQVALVIKRLTGVSYHPSHVCRLIHRMGWRVTPPY